LFKPHSVVSKYFQVRAGSGTYVRKDQEAGSLKPPADEMKF